MGTPEDLDESHEGWFNTAQHDPLTESLSRIEIDGRRSVHEALYLLAELNRARACDEAELSGAGLNGGLLLC
jgi:hypothetical protein